jgi:hypothetical protein
MARIPAPSSKDHPLNGPLPSSRPPAPPKLAKAKATRAKAKLRKSLKKRGSK